MKSIRFFLFMKKFCDKKYCKKKICTIKKCSDENNTQIVTNIKTSNCDQTQKFKLGQNSKTQNIKKKIGQNLKTKFVTKLKKISSNNTIQQL